MCYNWENNLVLFMSIINQEYLTKLRDLKVFNVSINTARTKLGGTKNAKIVLQSLGYTEDDRGYFYPPRKLPNQKTTPALEPIEVKEKVFISFTPEKTTGLIVTSYLIGSSVNKTIWKSIQALVKHTGYQLVVIAHQYRNPTNLQESLREKEGADYIDELVRPFLCWKDFKFGNHDILASIQVNCTNLNPLQRIKKIATAHTVIGHSSQSLLVKPVLGNKMANVLWSTGTISDIEEASNLTAKQAQFHYKFGCIVIERESQNTFEKGSSSRNVHFKKDGCFTDKKVTYTGEEPFYLCGRAYSAIIWGDTHHGSTCQDTAKWQLRLTEEFKPKNLYLHDFIDGATINPHANRLERTTNTFQGRLDIELKECSRQLEYINEILNEKGKIPTTAIKIVKSNHPDMISRYFLNTAIKDLSISELMVLPKWIEANRSSEELVRKMCGSSTYLNTKVIDEYTPEISKIKLNNHGDKGVNGSKSSPHQLFSNGFIGVIGHTHSPFILGGANGVGTSTKLDLGYNKYGASSWVNSLATVNIFEKVQHLIRFF
jgi:hypothetical protein